MNDERKVPESFKTYEEGKHRRYSLLFAVNGGAFALAKVMTDKDPSNASVGGLKLAYLCYGMALFTIVMSTDIFMFGHKMRTIYLPQAFDWQGKVVLVLICGLVCAGWVLVAN